MVNNSFVPARNDFLFPLEQEFNKFFDKFYNNNDFVSNVGKNSGFPKMDVYEKDNELVFNIAATGMRAEDFNIEVTPDNYLIVYGTMHEQYKNDESAKYYVKELRTSNFERKIKLFDGLVGEPTATLKDGILSLRWKLKPPESLKPKKKMIQITSE